MRALRRMSEDDAIDMFIASRWRENGGKPVCPHKDCCGDRIYNITVKRRMKAGIKPVRKFKCAACRRFFSPTSGTKFAHHKLELRDYLYAMAQFVNHVKGEAAFAMAREIPCQPKSAFVIGHKLREALRGLESQVPLTGKVELDSSGYGGKRRPSNFRGKKKREQGKKGVSEYVTEERQWIVAVRERNGETRAFVVPRETDAIPALMRHISKDATVFADEASAWNPIHSHAKEVRRINHSQYGYWSPDAHTNSVESFFSRIRRSAVGVHHRIAGRLVDAYAGEMAWRETHRRLGNGEHFEMLLDAVTQSPPSRSWTNYWDYVGKGSMRRS